MRPVLAERGRDAVRASDGEAAQRVQHGALHDPRLHAQMHQNQEGTSRTAEILPVSSMFEIDDP